MSDHDSDAQSPRLAETVNFAVFAAANTAAIHLLEIIQSQLSPPTLELHGDTIGYQLSIPLLLDKQNFRGAWRIGAGPPRAIIEKGLDHLKPDILLCPPEGSASARIARKAIQALHASLHFHSESGVLMLKTTSTTSSRCITYEHGDMDNQDLELIAPKTQTCVMRRSQNFLRFGDYRFVLEFVVQSQHKDKIKAYSTGYPGLYPSLALNPAPMRHSKTCFNVWLHNKIPNTSVTSGINIYTGEPVAVKQLQTKTALLPYTSKRLEIAHIYHERLDKGVLSIIDVWCEHNSSPPCFFNDDDQGDDDCCGRVFYSMPLAKYNFCDLPWEHINFENRLALFYHTLSGLAELHQQSITHGSISPESLLILSESKLTTLVNGQSAPRRAVISLSMQKRKTKPKASVCIAPEVWECDGNGNLDETKLDIWALAASWLWSFAVPPNNLKIRKHTHESLMVMLDKMTKRGSIKKPLDRLLRQMLAFEPQDRPNATDALADEIWRPLRDEKQAEEDNRKRRRTEMMNGDGGKRVRVLSPDPED
ncbi:uncharacterized protein TRIVIDRAFT_230726 [Trichoderma virens Gv29-8]|uniref:Protein kinase domain-containing protein n=1 Tax=Hypocrea virens (strain Gv29-8 / FGSC 10586) TaxID=413071 RepID=G9MSL3_HYPVG|nr:uncharacterized protein TRIVIDRAFT_230726 [Trichoderma virens Gv29-8]EHK23016.1 hypothetical protein TRIVIDRAFT_230726 [Trichoderma virens Gv29-8]